MVADGPEPDADAIKPTGTCDHMVRVPVTVERTGERLGDLCADCLQRCTDDGSAQ